MVRFLSRQDLIRCVKGQGDEGRIFLTLQPARINTRWMLLCCAIGRELVMQEVIIKFTYRRACAIDLSLTLPFISNSFHKYSLDAFSVLGAVLSKILCPYKLTF